MSSLTISACSESDRPKTLDTASATSDASPRRGPPSHRLRRKSVSAPEFRDDAEAAGLRFVHDNGHSQRNPPPPEAMCGGVGLLDYDGDGWLDVYVVQGGTFPPVESASNQGDRLFRNRGDGTFEDVTERAGIASFPGGYGHGVAVGDYDNDGRPDLFVTRWRSYALYRNKGDGTFRRRDGTTRAWAAIATGRPRRHSPISTATATSTSMSATTCCTTRRTHAVHSPRSRRASTNVIRSTFRALPDHVFRNDGGRFVDVTAESGFVDPDGRGLGVVAADLRRRRPDRPVRRQRHDGQLSLHQPGRVQVRGNRSDRGRGRERRRRLQGGHGDRVGDLDGDGTVDLAVTNYFGESTTFYRNLGQGFFADHSNAISMAAPTRRLLGFGIAFLDADNDGRARRALRQRPCARSAPADPLDDAVAALESKRERAGLSTFRNGPVHLSVRSISAVGSPSATSTTTGGSTPSSWLRTSRSSTCTTRRTTAVISSVLRSKERRRTVTVSGRGSRSMPAGAGRWPSATAAEAISPPTIRGFTLGWVRRQASNRSRSAGLPGGSIAMWD